MIKLKSLISEKFELPPDLEKQLEYTAYSALGYALYPHIEKYINNLHKNKKLNDTSYDQMKNVFDTVRKITEGNSVGNTTLTYKEVLVPNYYSTVEAKKNIRKETITIEKNGNDIYVQSKSKKDKLFPDMVISKDYGGWDLSTLEKTWGEIEKSYVFMVDDFDKQLISTEINLNKVSKWIGLNHPTVFNKKHNPPYLVYSKTSPYFYFHYFWVKPTNDGSDKYPDYFSSGENKANPMIVQTIFLDQFYPQYPSTSFITRVIETAKHEGRHLLQYRGNIEKNLKGDYYGGPKGQLRHSYDPEIRGMDSSGTASSSTPHKDPEDPFGRVLHPYRDVEFKTNQYNYKQEIEELLGSNYIKKDWNNAFKDVIKYIVGQAGFDEFRKKFPRNNYPFTVSVTKNHLKQLYDNDREKFNQVIKELYKLIFA